MVEAFEESGRGADEEETPVTDRRIRSPLRPSVGGAVVAIAVGVTVLAGAACTSDDGSGESVAVNAESLEDATPTDDQVSADGDVVSANGTDSGGELAADQVEADGSGQSSTDDGDAGTIAEELGTIIDETGEGLNGVELERYLARRYEAYWQAFDQARRTPTGDPGADYPELFGLAAGEQLEVAFDELVSLHANGHAIREPDTPAVGGLDANTAHRVRVESLEGGVAEIVSCLVNDQVRYEVDGGAVVSQNVLSVEARSTMAVADGTWKVIRSQATALDSGVAGCWLEDEADFPY